MVFSRKNSNTGKSKKRKQVSIDPSSPKIKLAIDSAPDLLEFGDASTPMADRYYELAETMNARGAMELAVPLYRQAIALLLSERDRLRQQLSNGQIDSDDNAFQVDKLQGLLDIEQAREEREVCEISSQEGFENKNISAFKKIENTDAMGFFVSSRLDSRIIELAEELTIESAQQVLLGLLELEQVVGELPSGGHDLRGKALMLQGEKGSAMSSFESAMALAPHHAGIRINTGAARLANGDLTGALSLLREVHGEGLELMNQATGNALLRNLSHAESQAGNSLKAICIRREWLKLNPSAVPFKRWLEWGLAGLQKPFGDKIRLETIQLLKDLNQLVPEERSLMKPLAMALEEEGKFREASLLYRKILRPK